MKRTKTWFQGTSTINIHLDALKESVRDPAKYVEGVIGLMPGITRASLIDQGEDFFTIETNEGEMHRSNIKVNLSTTRVTIEFDEKYQAGKMITATSHFVHEFVQEGDTLYQSLVIDSLKAPGFLGFFYRNFGSKNIGSALLKAHKSYLESMHL